MGLYHGVWGSGWWYDNLTVGITRWLIFTFLYNIQIILFIIFKNNVYNVDWGCMNTPNLETKIIKLYKLILVHVRILWAMWLNQEMSMIKPIQSSDYKEAAQLEVSFVITERKLNERYVA